MGMIALPAMSGYLSGGFSGFGVGLLMGGLAVKVCRSASRSFDEYRNKAAKASAIRREVRSLSALIGIKEPKLTRIFN